MYFFISILFFSITSNPIKHTKIWRQGWMTGNKKAKHLKLAPSWTGNTVVENKTKVKITQKPPKKSFNILNSTKYFSDKEILDRIKKTGFGNKVKNRLIINKTLKGEKCLSMLQSLGIPYKIGPAKPMLETPVILLTKTIGGVYYHWYWGEKNDLLLDCRMIISLYLAAPIFLRHGFDEILYTSSYRHTKVARTRRWSRHARGMALDVKALRGKNGLVAVVERDWIRVKGTPHNCIGHIRNKTARKMRALICDFERFPIFRRILTPDSNHAHRDHFHFSGSFLGESWLRIRYAGRIKTHKLASYRHKPTLKYPLPPRPKIIDHPKKTINLK